MFFGGSPRPSMIANTSMSCLSVSLAPEYGSYKTQQFRDWRYEANSKSYIWCYGGPGTGKTVLTYGRIITVILLGLLMKSIALPWLMN
jgi:hypothetical protein